MPAYCTALPGPAQVNRGANKYRQPLSVLRMEDFHTIVSWQMAVRFGLGGALDPYAVQRTEVGEPVPSSADIPSVLTQDRPESSCDNRQLVAAKVRVICGERGAGGPACGNVRTDGRVGRICRSSVYQFLSVLPSKIG